MLARSEALRQQIRDLVVCRYISQFNGFFFDFVSEPVVLDVEMLLVEQDQLRWAAAAAVALADTDGLWDREELREQQVVRMNSM